MFSIDTNMETIFYYRILINKMKTRVHLYLHAYFIFFWSLCCLFFFDIRILITPLVSSNSSDMLAIYMNINENVPLSSKILNQGFSN